MKKKICVVAFLVSLFTILGIVENVSCGGRTSHLLWCIIPAIIMYVSVKIGIAKD